MSNLPGIWISRVYTYEHGEAESLQSSPPCNQTKGTQTGPARTPFIRPINYFSVLWALLDYNTEGSADRRLVPLRKSVSTPIGRTVRNFSLRAH